jgi:2-keto-4-pentenoate hydratase
MPVTVPRSLHVEIAAELKTATATRRPVPPLSRRYPGLTLQDAYAIQQETLAMELASGAIVVGHKIGATSEAIRKMFDIDHPDFGFLTDRMLLPDGVRLDADRFIAPKIEGEIAFRMGADLSGDSVTAREVAAATAEIIPVLEILDSRIQDWAIRLVDTVADNASSAAVAVGRPVSPDGIDLAAEQMVFEAGGHVLTANGSAVMGHPAESVAWLARLLTSNGSGIRAGEIVLAGAWAAAVDVIPGSTVSVSFASLGSVALSVG